MKRWWSVLAVGTLVVLPLFTVGAWLYWNDRWAPVFDMALIEMRVRDVGTAHTPLLGLPGRLGRVELGCHPGPLTFYLLAPVYRLLGASYGALRLSMVAFNSLAIVTTLLIARRRAGAPAVIAAGLLIALLEVGYGPVLLTEPWNPHLPVLWFIAFLAAVWSVFCGDLPMLAVAAVAGSICAQTHISYVAACGGLGLFALGVAAVSWKRASRQGPSDQRFARWCLIAIGIVVVLWAPPVIEELTNKPGNISILIDYFTHPRESVVGFADARQLVLAHLDAWHIVVSSFAEPGVLRIQMPSSPASSVRGLLFLLLWAVSVPMARKLGSRPLLALHGLVAAALVVAATAISHIVGLPWNYLMLWMWGIGAGLLIVTASTFGLSVWKALPHRSPIGTAIVQGVGVAIMAVYGLRFAAEPEKAGSSTPTAARELAVLALATYRAIEDGTGAATGDKGRYFVTWTDALWKGGPGIGLVNELERRGLNVGVHRAYSPMIPMQRVMDPKDATAGIWLATGGWVHDPGRPPGSVPVAYFDPRSPEERIEFDQLRTEILAALARTGRKNAADAFDRDIGGARIDDFVGLAIGRLDTLGVPGAVFVHPIKRP